MEEFIAYLYQTTIFVDTLLIIKKIDKKKIYKLFPISNSLSLEKLYYCAFVTSTNQYIVQADESDVKKILQSIDDKQIFNSNCDTLEPDLYQKFIQVYHTIKDL